jgi:Kyakuja-Dileera-Zisupton transposase
MTATFPSSWPVNDGKVGLSFLVPKFHLPAHIQKCHWNYSFNYTKNVGRTDGEAPERGWSNLNGLAYSTREMGPGSREDTIEDHVGDWNWKKIVTMGKC